jgi:glycopeptide antibiotics resistance protein
MVCSVRPGSARTVRECPSGHSRIRSTWRLMTTRAKLETVVICAAFALYAVFALKLLLFSRPPGSKRSFNLIPFASISHYLFSGSSGVRRFAFGNIAGNVLLFIPLGSALSVLTKSTVARTMLIVASASVAVEILQGVFALGASDIDDVILNCLGVSSASSCSSCSG